MLACFVQELSLVCLVMKRYYFDWAASGIPDIELLNEALGRSCRLFGNPSSLHEEGRGARGALEEARGVCARVLGVPASTLVFTAGGTESNNLVMNSLLLQGPHAGVAVSVLEHSSISEPARLLVQLGRPLVLIKANKEGFIQADMLGAYFKENSGIRLVSLMAVHNETGMLLDIKNCVQAIRKINKNIHFHCDIVQAIGKTEVDLSGWGVDSASISAHKLGGPRGIGLLYVRKNIRTLAVGGGQENKMRSGTENLFGALALAAVLTRYAGEQNLQAAFSQAQKKSMRLIEGLKHIDSCSLIPFERKIFDERFSPYILQAAFQGVPGEVMVRLLNDKGFSVSTGAACGSFSWQALPPPMSFRGRGVDGRSAQEAVRISFGHATKEDEIDQLLLAIKASISSLV